MAQAAHDHLFERPVRPAVEPVGIGVLDLLGVPVANEEMRALLPPPVVAIYPVRARIAWHKGLVVAGQDDVLFPGDRDRHIHSGP